MAFIALFLAMFSFVAFGQDLLVPDVDPLLVIVELFKNWKELSPIAIGISLVIIVVQVVKMALPDDFKHKKLLVLVFSGIYAVLFAVAGGTTWLGALVLVFITNNLAKELYDAWRGVVKAVVK